MALPEFSMRQLLEAGAHFGHQTHRWNPKMDRYIFGEKSNIHILDLSQSVPLLHQALAGRHADQLADGVEVDRASARTRAADVWRRHWPHQARSAEPDAREGQA